MALYHSGNKKLVQISCNDFTLTFTGKFQDKKSNDLNYNQNVTAGFTVASSEYNNIESMYVNDDGELVQSKSITIKPRFFENGSYQIMLESDDDTFNIDHFESDISKSIQCFKHTKVANIEFESEVGFSTFAVTKDGKVVLSVTIEVFPSKLDYRSDYNSIMNEVNEEVDSIIYNLIGKTVLQTKLKETDHQTNTEFISIFKDCFNELDIDIKRICNNLKHNVQTVETVRRVEKARIPSRKTVDYIRKHPSSLIEDDRGFIALNGKNHFPTIIVDKRKITTTDIYENQFVKYMISTIIKRLDVIEKNIAKRYKDENKLVDYINEKKNILKTYLKRYFANISDLKDKKTMSLVFQMSPGYKDLFKRYEILKKGLAIGEGLYNITPKKIYTLYEVWCYVTINKILKNLGYTTDSKSFIRYEDNGLFLSILQEEKAEMIYSSGDKELALWYNKVYNGLPTTDQKPDTVLCIKNLTNDDDIIYIFDAKYRVNTDRKVGPMEEDINVMHRYRDSIVSQMNNNRQFKYDTFGAYVMFPYADQEEFKTHPFYKSIESVNIGAFPMLPGRTSLIEEHLRKITGQSKLDAISQRVFLDEEDYNNRFKVEDLIVANASDSQHYETYKNHKFYHIPKKAGSSKLYNMKYLALYKSKSNFSNEEYAGIHEYAEILSVGEYKRGECKELPSSKRSDPNEIYIRFELGEFINTNTVKVDGTGIRGAFLYSNLYLLKNAQIIQELKLKSQLHEDVYKELQKITKNNKKIKKIPNGYRVNNIDVVVYHDVINIIKSSKKIATLTKDEITHLNYHIGEKII